MKITDEQEKALNNLVCERLSSDPQNIELINNFESKKGSLIVDYLKSNGIEEDKSGNMAFYIVKTRENDVLMFFSLKCGALFDYIINEESIIEKNEEYLIIIQAIQNIGGNEEDTANLISKIEKLSREKGISISEVLNRFVDKISKKDLLDRLKEDISIEINDKIARVNRTYPGVELVHFCVNDNAREIWKSLNIPHPMGETVFWRFIVNIILEVRNIVGCEYAFLFAADLSDDSTLINYYNVALNFEVNTEVATNKPAYDFACAFMCQSLDDIVKNKEYYFENFNVDESDDIV